MRGNNTGMKITNFEFKASVGNISVLEERLKELGPDYVGEDNQTDTYFQVPHGRLKLREGNIETALIYYEREDESGTRQSDVILYKHRQGSALKKILTKLHGVKTVVKKKRRIYYIDNVKFHFDNVKGIGTFIEVEAIDETGRKSAESLRQQCMKYADFFGISQSDYVPGSYCDMVLQNAE